MVEDSRDVADVTSALLEQLGYRVVRAENAAEALRHLQQGIEFDLLFSDIVMPGTIDGIGLAQICREQFPDLPVLLTSGFSDAARAADGRFDILRKPFELSVLERAIEQVIGDARPRARRDVVLTSVVWRTDDPLDLVERVVLTVDRQDRRALREID